jgi:ATP-dependent helicase/nuclease subunit A
MVEAPGAVPPRELVIASAGSGKTYRLSQRIIELLDGGAAPEEILASTFTRKAAGEILDRVLLRLAEGALDPEKAAEVGIEPARCAELLRRLVSRLHAVNVGTLDSFFQRVSRAFSLELGLPAGWILSQGPMESRLRSEAVSRMLDEADQGAAVEMVRLLQGGRARRGVHEMLLDQVADLHGLFMELDPGADDPWGFPADDREWGPPVEREERGRVAAAIVGAPIPTRADGGPNANWVRGREQAAAYVREGAFEDFLGKGLGAAALSGEYTYYRAPMPEALAAAVDRGVGLARRVLGPRLQNRAQALGRLLPRYDRWIHRLRKEAGLYEFSDVTRVLAESVAGGRGEELYYRLDARIRHVLLDEFQDTSMAQWWAIRPLVEEVLSGYRDERGVVIVADPKQSIYGWRGGEPRILEAIEEHFELPRASLYESWRSGPDVLDLVNRVFQAVPDSGLLEEGDRTTVRRWMKSFHRHVPAPPREGAPGRVEIAVGPAEEGRSSLRPRLLAHAARKVAGLHRDCPRATIGVLTRTNRAVARLMGELRRLGVDASEEGGVPVADSSAVLSVLALVRMADHPGDSAARYQVAHTPVRALVRDFDWRKADSAARVASGLRRRLAREGYGPVVAGWVRKLEARAGPRDRRRLRQLAELAFRWDEESTLRPGDFVRWVEEERVEDPAASPVRVMTVHQAKGLQFDIVVLPALDSSLTGRGGERVYPFRPTPDAPVSRVYPGMRKELIRLFPSVEPAVAQVREARLRDGLSGLYVALTRARFALHLVVKPDGSSGPSTSLSGARLVREALGIEGRIEEGQILFQEGLPRWWAEDGAPAHLRKGVERKAELEEGPEGVGPGVEALPSGGPLLARRGAGGRRRLLARRSPSELEGGGTIRIERILRDRGGRAREEGTLVHEWLREVEWIEDGLPSLERCQALARQVAPGIEDLEAHRARLQEWLAVPQIREALSRASYPEGARVETERPFLVRDGDTLLQGVVDRLVIVPGEDGAPSRAWILDYKTDRIDGALEARVEIYRPQLEAYARAVAGEEGLPDERVRAALVFLRPGKVAWLGTDRDPPGGGGPGAPGPAHSR